MTDRMPDPPGPDEEPPAPAADEPEPGWAATIRELRKARGARLAEALADDDRPEPPVG